MAIDGGLRQMFRTKLPKFFWVPIETVIGGGGVPDHWWCCDGVSGWNEYKQTQGYVINFRPEQIGWHQRLARAGGRSFIIVRRRTKRDDELWLYHGVDAAPSMLRELTPLLRCAGGPATWSWPALAALLLGRPGGPGS